MNFSNNVSLKILAIGETGYGTYEESLYSLHSNSINLKLK